MTTRFKVTGLEDVLRRLKELQGKLPGKILSKGLRAGAKIILAEQKARAPVSNPAPWPEGDPRLVPGLLAASLGIKAKTYRSRGVVVFVVGPRTNIFKNKRTKVRKRTSWITSKRVQKLFAEHAGAKFAQKQTPTAYAHLAGPHRKEEWFSNAALQALGFAQQAIIDVLSTEIDKAASS